MCAEGRSDFLVGRFGGDLTTGLKGTDDPSDLLVKSLKSAYGSATGLSCGDYSTKDIKGYVYLNPATEGPSADIPGALIELGFISGDYDFMTSDLGQKRMALGIAEGIDRFIHAGQPSLRIGTTSGLVSFMEQDQSVTVYGSGFRPSALITLRAACNSDAPLASATPFPAIQRTVLANSQGAFQIAFSVPCTQPEGWWELWVGTHAANVSSWDNGDRAYALVSRNPLCSGTTSPATPSTTAVRPTTTPSTPATPTAPAAATPARPTTVRPVTPSPILGTGSPTAVVLVMDVSGSMGSSWQGGAKLDSARQAALDFLELVGQEAQATGVDHRVAVVGVSTDVYVFLPLTSDFAAASRTIINLQPTDSTNLGAGLQAGLTELRKLGSAAKRFMILLSDGMTNTGLGRDEILAGPVAQARQFGICINTVGFGDPGDIDDQFLREIARGSGCGGYYYAGSGLQLFGAFAQIRAQALGQVIPELSSFGKQVTILPGTSVALGTFFLPEDQDEVYLTLGWVGQGGLQMQLQDPSGTNVTPTYPGAHFFYGKRFSHVIIQSPASGFWKVAALPNSGHATQVEYISVGSTRPGGVVFSLPLPVITVAGKTFALPGGIPTPILILISIAAIALAIWRQLSP
jgi:Mg-chelatase subunit ChlD